MLSLGGGARSIGSAVALSPIAAGGLEICAFGELAHIETIERPAARILAANEQDAMAKRSRRRQSTAFKATAASTQT